MTEVSDNSRCPVCGDNPIGRRKPCEATRLGSEVKCGRSAGQSTQREVAYYLQDTGIPARLVQFMYRLLRDAPDFDAQGCLDQTSHGPAVYSNAELAETAVVLASQLVPRFPDHMARIVEAKNAPLTDRIARLAAALEAIPDFMRQYEWQADEKQLFGSKWVRSVAGDNGKGRGRQAIAEVVNHINVADFIAAASPDTITMLLAERAELIVRAERAEQERDETRRQVANGNDHVTDAQIDAALDAMEAEIDARQEYEVSQVEHGGRHRSTERALSSWLDARAKVIAALSAIRAGGV